MVYTLLFFSSERSLFHNSNVFGFCIIHILYTGCAKIKKNNSGAKRLTSWNPLGHTRPVMGLLYLNRDRQNTLIVRERYMNKQCRIINKQSVINLSFN